MKLSTTVDPSEVVLEGVDLTDPLVHSHGDPHGIWKAMRHRDPVRWQDVGDTLGFWSVTTYEDADVVLRDHTRFTSQRGTMLFLLGKDDPARGRQMAATDPPRHSRMREPMQRALSARQVEAFRPAVTEAVRALLAPGLSGEPFDFGAAMMTLPMASAGTMLGLPRADWPRLTELTAMSIAPDDPEFASPHGATRTLELAHRELFAYFHDIVRERRDRPGDDLISMLLGMEIDGRHIETGAILSNCYSLILGANVTTPFVPTGALPELIATDAFARIQLDPGLLGGAVDESLRWASPANHFMRYALRDVELHGTQIKAGDAVVVWLGSANRDETVFDEPFRFDITRKPNRHIAFGAGAHYCVGHSVARMTTKILFTELMESFDSVELAGEPTHLQSNFVAGITHQFVRAHVRPDSRGRLGVLVG